MLCTHFQRKHIFFSCSRCLWLACTLLDLLKNVRRSICLHQTRWNLKFFFQLLVRLRFWHLKWISFFFVFFCILDELIIHRKNLSLRLWIKFRCSWLIYWLLLLNLCSLTLVMRYSFDKVLDIISSLDLWLRYVQNLAALIYLSTKLWWSFFATLSW